MSRPLLSMYIEPDPSEDELLFARQLGVDCVYTWVKTEQRTYEHLARLRERVESHGLRLYNAGNIEVAKNDKIHLALPGRDQAIADFQAFVRDLGRAGIGVTTFTWEPTQVWSSAPGETRGAQARGVDLDEMLRRPFTHGRAYSEEEIWDNFTTFIRQMMPVCRGSRGTAGAPSQRSAVAGAAGRHPVSDPQLRHVQASVRHRGQPATQLGMEFCCGCWLEGGERFGDIFEGIRTFTRRRPHPDRPLPKRHRAAAALRRDVPGQRLHGHVPRDEDVRPGRLPRHHDPRSLAEVRGRLCQGERDRLCHRQHARADGAGARRGLDELGAA